MKLFFETHGEGRPLILLHGGITAFEQWDLQRIAARRKVIAVHLQGHGQTADIDRPYSYQSSADDVAEVVRDLDLDQVDIAGWSFGGACALQFAIRHPRLARKLCVISSPMKRDGFFPETVQAFLEMPAKAAELAGHVARSPLPKLYPKTDWEASFRKMGQLNSQPWDYSADVRKLKLPVLLIYADADTYRAEHIVEFYQALGGAQRDAGLDGSLRSQAQLAILPNTTHYNIPSNPLFYTLLDHFFA